MSLTTSPFHTELGRRFKQARVAKGLTLMAAYEATGIHVGRIEGKHGRDVQVSTLVRLCQLYDIEPGVILAGLPL